MIRIVSVELNPLYDGYNVRSGRNNPYLANVNPWRNQVNAPADSGKWTSKHWNKSLTTAVKLRKFL